MIYLSLIFAAAVIVLARQHAHSLERLTSLHDARLDRLVAFQQADRDRWAQERLTLMEGFDTERLSWERERGELLNRIKPETTQYVPVRMGDTPSMPAPLPYDDDEAFQQELESREVLAERLAQEELSGRTG